MKNLNNITPGNYAILSDKEMKNVAAGYYAPGSGCDINGGTCSGTCGIWEETPEGLEYWVGTCVTVHGGCDCAKDSGGI